MNESSGPPEKPRLAWPWFVLTMVLFGFALAILWVGSLVKRIREQRQFSAPVIQIVPATNASAARAAAYVYANPAETERMREFQDTLSGGNAEAGRKVFFENPAANCGKCHKADGQGGDNGPVLDGIGTRQPREFILESILFPNAVINTNFETVAVLLKSNSGVSGTVKAETDTQLVLNTPEDGPVTIDKSEIQSRWKAASPMPEGIWQALTKEQLRDVIEFVATLPARKP